LHLLDECTTTVELDTELEIVVCDLGSGARKRLNFRLAGHTPRECANDPTRRPDLIRLLDSFPQNTDRPGTMSPARLRAALDLS
jgi:hypothetical protein